MSSVRFFNFLSAAGFVLLVLLTAAPATPQQAPGTLEGVVLDEQGEFLPGVTITIQDGSVDRTVVSDTEGKYRFTDLPQGFYNNLTAALDGFQTNRTFITITGGRSTYFEFLLRLERGEGESVLRSIGNAADNLPPFLKNSGLAPGSIAVIYGENMGSPQLVQADRLPLGDNLDGFSSWLEQNGESFVAKPIYQSQNQSAIVVPSQVTTGVWTVFTEYQGKRSNGFRVNVEEARPALFTRHGNGQGQASVTFPDFSLATFFNPLAPGDFATFWGTGYGPSLFDDRGLVFDKRGNYDRVEITFGGVSIPEENIFYIGSMGCCAAGDQVIVKIPDGVRPGCATPVAGGLYIKDTFQPFSPVSVPVVIRSDDDSLFSPCNDDHGLTKFDWENIKPRLGLPYVVGGLRLTDHTSVVGPDHRRTDSQQVTFGVDGYTESNYGEIPSTWTCTKFSYPEFFSYPFFSRILDVTGDVNLDRPSIGNVVLNESSIPGYYESGDPATILVEDEPYTIDVSLTVNGLPFQVNWSGQFDQAAPQAKRAVVDKFIEDPTLPAFLPALRDLGLNDPDVGFVHETFVNMRQQGTITILCAGTTEVTPALEESLIRQYEFLVDYLPDAPHRADYSVTFQPNERGALGWDGPIDKTETFCGCIGPAMEISSGLIATEW